MLMQPNKLTGESARTKIYKFQLTSSEILDQELILSNCFSGERSPCVQCYAGRPLKDSV